MLSNFISLLTAYLKAKYHTARIKYYKTCTLIKYRRKNIRIGGDNIFIGHLFIHQENNSHITIGNHNTFLSKGTSNNIGLNHKCMISATPLKDKTCSINIGNNNGFSGVSIWCFEKITIGNNCKFGANALIMDGDAHFEDSRTSPPSSITIEDNVWIGANACIKKGVTIGQNSIIGMNSVVTHSIPANCIAAGNPCKIIKYIIQTT